MKFLIIFFNKIKLSYKNYLTTLNFKVLILLIINKLVILKKWFKIYFNKIIFFIIQKIKELYFKYYNKQFWLEFFKNLATVKYWKDLYYYFFVELQKPKVFSDSLFDQIDLNIRLFCILLYYLFLWYYIILIVGCWLLSVFGFL